MIVLVTLPLSLSQLYEREIADVMRKEHEKAIELEKLKEQEKWQQSMEYQELLEKQLEEQVCVSVREKLCV